jgi:uncharacterized PurR-regulated membrane protein YhhQ (DUF165 family)
MVWWAILYYPIFFALLAALPRVEKRYGEKRATKMFAVVWGGVYLFPVVYGVLWLLWHMLAPA